MRNFHSLITKTQISKIHKSFETQTRIVNVEIKKSINGHIQ